jgi:Sulfotransferase family
MTLSELKKINLESLYWNYLFGKPIRKGTILDIRKAQFKNVPNPAFFLSTGRCGTMWFTSLISLDKEVRSFHEPLPNMSIQGQKAYNIFAGSDFSPSNNEKELLKEIFITGRSQYLRHSFKSEKRYIETNNFISFFAPILVEIFPDAKFVHVVRHPGEYVRSAMRRNFFNDNIEDIKRISPNEQDPYHSQWNDMDRFSKSAWLWKETNSYIEKCKQTIGKNNYHLFNFNDLSLEQVNNLINFLELKIDPKKAQKQLRERKNIQKTGDFKSYEEWPEKEKSRLREICEPWASKYGYQL